MRKLSINQMCNARRSFEEDVELIARAGIPGIGVYRGKLEAVGLERGLKLVRDAGLEVACYGAAGWFLNPGGREQAIDQTKRAIETAARLQAGCLVIVSGPRGDLEWSEANRRFVDALAEVLPEARQHGVPLAYEALSPMRVEVSYLHLMSDTLEVVEEVDSPFFGVALDIWYHWWQRDFAEQVRRGAEKTFLVQISDHYADTYSMWERAPLGQGILPLKKVLREIDAAGYAGWYDVEVFPDRLSETEQVALAADSKAAFAQLWD
ncbi:MAG: sugar phosphate isomerase/epimerase [Chloroflexi bacterium]|nr:sugar phosphate isomerase/epimerase [Chloroflexota bacterium]MCH8283603.1 sugar phosphate isomerase/epimerase [Chloroflexota bacterium]